MTGAAGYSSARDHLGDMLTLLALRLQREVAVLRALRRPGRNESFLGLFLSDEDADDILRELTGEIAGTDTTLDAAIAAMQIRIANRLAATDRMLPLARLCGAFGLSGPAFEIILGAAAPALDDRFGRVYGFLNDDMGRRGFTLAIAVRMLAEAALDMPALRQLLAPDAALRANCLVRAVGPEPLAMQTLTVDERIVDLLLDQAPDATALPMMPVLGNAAWAHLTELVDRIVDAPLPVSVDLSAKADAGLLAAGMASRLGLGVRVFDWRTWAVKPVEPFADAFATALRDARLDATLPLLIGFDSAPAPIQASIAEILTSPAILSAPAALHWHAAGLKTVEVTPPPAPVTARAAVWNATLAEPGLAAEMAGFYDLPSHEIADLVAHAARLGGDPALALRRTAKRRAGQPMAAIAERIETGFSFDDLVLGKATLQQLGDFTAWRQHGTTVLADWGLGPVFGKSTGATALFLGPSGTGKTMAASVIANTLELELYRVDLAGVISKYIGETEKNLDRVFDAAHRADVVLFFDEADALFGKRSEVSDAHDRYANIEVSYLLQRMESFGGTAILATNLGQNLDEAFLRRIDAVIEFQAPQRADRLRLWQRLQQTGAPLADDVNLAVLAERFELTGGEIRNCCLSAAHLAAAEANPIAMRHLMRAVGREYVKTGKPLRRAVFGEYYADLRVAGGGAA